MKKAIIAGAASAVLAAMPVVGVFATADFTDNLNLKINNACTFSRSGTAHANGSASWGTGEETPTPLDTDTLYGTVSNGQSYNSLGTSTFVVTCNNQYGYKVEVDASDFSATGTAANAADEYAWAYAAGGTLNTNGNSMWTIASSKTGTGVDLANDIVATASAPVSADAFTVTYMAFVDATQPADTYTASADYTFSQLAE